MHSPEITREWIKCLPKAELHLHIEGTLEPELMFRLAARNQVQIPFSSIEDVKKAYHFNNLQEFLDIYYQGAAVLLQEVDFYDLTWDYLLKMHEENVRHVEIFFDPQTHTDRGVSFASVINGIHRALQDAQQKFGISSRLIMCFLRHKTEADAITTLKDAVPFREWIQAVGLDSSELGHPPEKFKRVYQMAREQGYDAVAHAGEEGDPSYVWEALDLLQVKRIDHGVRSIEDPRLVKTLADQRIPLTVCPLSNQKLKVFPDLKDHSLKKLLDLNVRVTVNSDDPAYFGGYLTENFLQIQRALSLSKGDILKLIENSFAASFIADTEKENLIEELRRRAVESPSS